MSRPQIAVFLLLLAAVYVSTCRGDDGGAPAAAVAQSSLAQMPVTEITVFKDGHAFVLHEGRLPTDERGNVRMDYLPTPVIGTFWPYSADPRVKLTSVTAGSRAISVERTALDVRSLLEANVGARITVRDTFENRYFQATIVGLPERGAEELAETSPPNTPPQLPQKGGIILLGTEEGTRVMPIDRIAEVVFRDAPQPSIKSEEFRNVLTLRLQWPEGQQDGAAQVGMAYLQRGIRWIPSYKITIDGEGKAHVQLNATLLNELADLEDVTANLVIGVPTFAFKETVDPISLQQSLAQLSPYFDQGSNSQMMLSNSIMTQSARMGEYRVVQPPPATAGDLGPDVGQSNQSEDLYVFTVQHVSLKKGERMVLPVVEYDLEYRDVYTLDLPFAPPPEIRQQFNDQQQAELARLFYAPKVMHQIRLANRSEYPLTTGPALIVKEGRLLAQGMMTYTAPGASTDLPVTAAVDIQVRKSDEETARALNAAQWQGNQFARIDLEGTICLVNFHGQPVELEVTRHALGTIDEADHEGLVAKVNAQDESWRVGTSNPYWWGWYSWPYWWHHFNGVGRVTWKVKLDPKESVDLGYKWHYFWQ